jgi:hypothetical protein
VDIGIGPVASRLTVAGWGPSQFTLFGRGQDNRIKNRWWDGNAWTPPTARADNLGGTFQGDPIAVTYRGNWKFRRNSRGVPLAVARELD